MRIGIVGMHYAPEPSGNAPYTTGLAVGLAKRGHEVEVVTGVPHYPQWSVHEGYGGWRSRAHEDDVSVTRLRHYVPSAPTAFRRVAMESSFGARAALDSTVRSSEVVVCVSPALISSAFVVQSLRCGRQRPALGLWVQDLYSRGIVETQGVGGRTASLAAALEGAVVRRFDGVAVAHERFKVQLVEGFKVPSERVEVIRNWTHISVPDHPDVAGARTRLGWRAGEVIALHAGNMGMKQGLENIVAAARLADERQSNVRFVLLGGGNQLARLRERADGVSRIEFVDSLPDHDFVAALSAADVLLVNELPGVKEMSVPSKLTSYFASGRPVVAASEQGSVTAQEIEGSGAGLRVNPGKPHELLDAVQALGADPERSAGLGEMGQRFLTAHLTEQVAMDRFESWIARLSTSNRTATLRETS